MTESKGETGCGCHGDTNRAAVDPAYRRALWIVVILNAGFGIIELFGGFLANSQALKADSLDFLGDGSITFEGAFACGEHSVSKRARLASTSVAYSLEALTERCKVLRRDLSSSPDPDRP